MQCPQCRCYCTTGNAITADVTVRQTMPLLQVLLHDTQCSHCSCYCTTGIAITSGVTVTEAMPLLQVLLYVRQFLHCRCYYTTGNALTEGVIVRQVMSLLQVLLQFLQMEISGTWRHVNLYSVTDVLEGLPASVFSGYPEDSYSNSLRSTSNELPIDTA